MVGPSVSIVKNTTADNVSPESQAKVESTKTNEAAAKARITGNLRFFFMLSVYPINDIAGELAARQMKDALPSWKFGRASIA